MSGAIYKKPILFAVVALVVVLAGTVATMFYPLLREDMHPKLAALRPYTPLELAGRDIYQREGCMGCHTQTIRPLLSEVKRYGGEYSKAGEFAYDRPHLWGSKRTGPDLAREGGFRPDDWHRRHFENPQAIVPKSNMPAYAFLKDAKLDPASVKAHYVAFASLYKPGEFAAKDGEFTALADRTEMDALVAYMQWLGHAVPRVCDVGDLAAGNPLAGSAKAAARGKEVFENSCMACHGEKAEGGVGPSLLAADQFLRAKGAVPDGTYFGIIQCGSDAKKEIGRPGDAGGGMTAFGGELSDDDIWSVVEFIRTQQRAVAK